MSLDVDALRLILDGKYHETRALVRTNLAEHARVLLDAETMSLSLIHI